MVKTYPGVILKRTGKRLFEPESEREGTAHLGIR